jgi:hypothetical protein
MLKDQFSILLIPLEFAKQNLVVFRTNFIKKHILFMVHKDNNPSMNQIHGWYVQNNLICIQHKINISLVLMIKINF